MAEPMKEDRKSELQQMEDDLRDVAESWKHVDSSIDKILIRIGRSNRAKIDGDSNSDLLTEDQELELLKSLQLYSTLEAQGRTRNAYLAKRYWARRRWAGEHWYLHIDESDPDIWFGWAPRLVRVARYFIYILVSLASVVVLYAHWPQVIQRITQFGD